MNNWLRNNSNCFFFGFLISIVVFFFTARPLNSSWHRFIAGDGLGYYSYLPARHIYADKQFEFKWFNEVYNRHYSSSSFPNPEDNFMVEYHGRRINKYYQGLSFIWTPFFLAAHIVAKIFHYPADGFSEPYQLFMGLASLFYVMLGLFFLRKLLFRLFNNLPIANFIPSCIFYGTFLFQHTINLNTLSHVYSFTFLTLYLYFVFLFFNEPEKKLRSLLLCLLFLVISVCIRPLNGLAVLMAFAFIPKGFFRQKFVPGLRGDTPAAQHFLILILLVVAVAHNLFINLHQSGALFPYTYTDEHFDFRHPRFFSALFSYHAGLFVYVPLVFISLGGLFFMPRKWLVLPFFFFAMLFIYSCWWYWPITKRAMIDFYFIPAILLGTLFQGIKTKKIKWMVFILMICSVAYHHLKNYQLNQGILDENLTYKEVFWRNFFKTQKSHMYLIPPASIIKQNEHFNDFEMETNNISTESRNGRFSLLLDKSKSIATVFDQQAPSFFDEPGRKKIRFSFWVNTKKPSPVHAFIQFKNNKDSTLKEVPFYLNEEDVVEDKWVNQEFGYEIRPEDKLERSNIYKINFIIWNVEGKETILVDDVKVDFILTDESFETVK